MRDRLKAWWAHRRILRERRKWDRGKVKTAALFPELAVLDRLRAASPTLVYTEVEHDGAIIRAGGHAWVVDSVDVLPVAPACMREAVAYLSELEDPG